LIHLITQRQDGHKLANSPLKQARACHQEVLEAARDLSNVLLEANALAGLGRCALAEGRSAEAADWLRQALAIFQRIGTTEAATVAAELDALQGKPGLFSD
jgi:tetratricopeptide (TPR) repeat protein